MKLEDTNIKLPQHIIENHIEIDDAEMKNRLINGNYDNMRYTGIKTCRVTKFKNEELAETVIKQILTRNESLIRVWLRDRYDKRLVLNESFLFQLGYGYVKGTSFTNQYPAYCCTLILELGYNGNHFEIVTAYPDFNAAVLKRIEIDKRGFYTARKK